MSDLTRLNPTPHAIAVYASQPPSPVTTQHSLPSGRCPLLGPDFHRLDRTSLPGALIRSPHRRAAELTVAQSGQVPWQSRRSRPSRISPETSPEDRPASRRVECG